MTRKQIVASVVAAVIASAATSFAASHTPPNRIAISTERVASAMMDAGWKVGVGQIKMLSEVSVVASAPSLQVVQVTHWQDDKLKAQLRCRDPRACLPFYVLVDRHAAVEADASPLDNEVVDAAENHPELDAPVETLVMKSGDPAKMLFEQKGLSITMPVICLQGGRRGQTIRVSSADHKRFYKAEVVAPGLLKAATL